MFALVCLFSDEFLSSPKESFFKKKKKKMRECSRFFQYFCFTYLSV